MNTSLYLDYAAASPMDESVKAAMEPYLTDNFYNPSALYLSAKAVHQDITRARQQIASAIGAKPSEIIFTAGGTEANNLAIHGVLQAHPNTNSVVSAIEHESVLLPAKGYDHRIVPVSPQGIIDEAELLSLIDDHTVLVSVMLANNEIGSVQPIHRIAQKLDEIRSQRRTQGNQTPLYFHTDAAQATAYLDVHVARLGVDLMTINGGKIYGPKQSGLLFVKTGTKLNAQLQGGGQERGIRSGTENVPAIMGLAAAIELVTSRRKAESHRLAELQHHALRQISTKLPKLTVNGSLKHRLPNSLNITIPGSDNERMLMELDERGIMCATGSACSASNEEPSHVLAAIGLSEADIRSSLRFSFGHATTQADIDRLIKELEDLTKSL